MVLTLKKEILFLNRRMIQLFNIPGESTKKMGLNQVIPDAPFVELISNAITNKQELFQKEFETLLPRPMILKINLAYDKKQKPELFTLSVANVTQSEMNIREKFKVECEIIPDDTSACNRTLSTIHSFNADLAIPSFEKMLATL